MSRIITTGQAFAASMSLSFAVTGAKLEATGRRLEAFAAKPSNVAPVLVAAVLLLSMHPAVAQTAGGTGSLDSFLNNVVNLITGTTGQAIAIIAVALCGLGAMFGALSARAFGGVVFGCAMMFSAAWIVGKITGGGA